MFKIDQESWIYKLYFSGADRLAGALAFFVEGYLFANHVHGRSVLDTQIHLLIVLICYASSFGKLIKIKCKKYIF